MSAFYESASDDKSGVRVRGRSYLAGADSLDVPEFIPRVSREQFLTLARPWQEGSLARVAEQCREIIDKSLYEQGAIIFKDLPLHNASDFNAFINQLGYAPFSYNGGIAVRNQVAGHVLMASNEDSRITLAPHNEMAYLLEFPRKLFFFCAREGLEGGEVPISDIRESVKQICPNVLARFRDVGIRYYRNLPRATAINEIGWEETFGTSDKSTIEQIMLEKGYEFVWDKQDRLSYSYVNPAFVTHPDTGEELWFNQVTELHCSYWRNHPQFPPDLPDNAYPATTAYGDGTPIPVELITYLRAVLWQPAKAVKMRQGDLLALDNLVIQHGRIGFSGPRQHMVSITA
ncbi:TauD/TfdA family dioxygenase [Pseudomonas sp. Irchel s3a18]|uniref:TauD/TfdA family dioxygenase n=1 Tax=Pseudomonas sp. Irchel s3a18 TaxID=2009053 RepID=UPI000BA4563E|nr:TauD/TfdA family dioxygenase [Pseudomonas sp. Irchel s3a18]